MHTTAQGEERNNLFLSWDQLALCELRDTEASKQDLPPGSTVPRMTEVTTGASDKTRFEPLASWCPPLPLELRGGLTRKDTWSSLGPVAKPMARAGSMQPHGSMSARVCSEQLITEARAGEVRN